MTDSARPREGPSVAGSVGIEEVSGSFVSGQESLGPQLPKCVSNVPLTGLRLL